MSAFTGTCIQGLAPVRNSTFQTPAGTKAESAPAIKKPARRSFQSIDQSMAKFWAMTTRARGWRSFCHRLSPSITMLSCSWPPGGLGVMARLLHQPRRMSKAYERGHDGDQHRAADPLGGGELPAHQRVEDDAK